MSTEPYPRREFLKEAATAGVVLLGSGAALNAAAQAGLETLLILCTGPGGSVPDTVARRIAEQLTGRLARHVVVENRPGAAGQIAINALKSAPADGSTVLLAQGAIATVSPSLYAKLAYDPVVDLQPVSLASEMTLGLAVGPAVPARVATISDFVTWMRQNPKLANVGSPGTGTLPHLLEVMLFQNADVPWQHVVYSGGPPALVDLLGGQISALVLPEGLLRQHRASGKLRVLATSGKKRSAYLPEVASFVEQGYADLVVREWFAFFMPGQTPAAITAATSQALQLAIAKPELAAAFAESGMVPAWSTPSVMAVRIATERRFWEPIIRATGVRAE